MGHWSLISYGKYACQGSVSFDLAYCHSSYSSCSKLTVSPSLLGTQIGGCYSHHRTQPRNYESCPEVVPTCFLLGSSDQDQLRFMLDLAFIIVLAQGSADCTHQLYYQKHLCAESKKEVVSRPN